MKKTIAILLILVLAGVGLFAADASTTGHNANINLKTHVSTIALFGLSEDVLEASDYLSLTAFNAAVVDTRTIETQPMTNFAVANEGVSVGFVSGINNTLTDITLFITVTPFTSLTATSASIPLSVSPVSAVITKAVGTMGTLQSTEMTVIESTAGTIELAPAVADYTATVTISISSNG